MIQFPCFKRDGVEMGFIMNTRSKQFLALLLSLGLCYITMAIGALASINARTFYAALVQPSWAPPGWVFGPVWLTLYTMMGIAAWLVWRQGGFAAHHYSLVLFIGHLIPNALWSWMFFDWQLGAASFATIVILWVLIVATMVCFWRVRPISAALLMPYLLWVSFASALNLRLWQLNPEVLG